jgi:hypothetical protein
LPPSGETPARAGGGPVGLPLLGDGVTPTGDDDMGAVLAHRVLLATLAAAACGYAMLRHSKQMLFEGTSLRDGGGLAALVMVEFTLALGSLAVALS